MTSPREWIDAAQLIWQAEGILMATGAAATAIDAEWLIVATADRLGLTQVAVAEYVHFSSRLPE